MSDAAASLVEFHTHGKIYSATVRSHSVLSAANIAEFGAELLAFVEQHPGISLIIDFQHVDYLSSAVLNELLRVDRAVEEAKGHLRLCAVSPTILEIFQITNLDKKFVIHPDHLEEDLKRVHRALEIAEQEAAWDEKA